MASLRLRVWPRRESLPRRGTWLSSSLTEFSSASCRNRGSLATEDSPSFAARQHDVLDAFHGVLVLGSFESSRIWAAQLTQSSLKVRDRIVFVLLHPLEQACFEPAEVTDSIA